MDEADIKIDNSVLSKFIRTLKDNKKVVRVGILGNNNARKEGGLTNSQIGAAHEFGAPSRNLPQRSFLLMPLKLKIQETISRDGVFSKEQQEKVLRERSIVPWLKVVQGYALAIVKEAFVTHGYGTWEGLKERTVAHKQKMGYPSDPLVATMQLRDSINSDIK